MISVERVLCRACDACDLGVCVMMRRSCVGALTSSWWEVLVTSRRREARGSTDALEKNLATFTPSKTVLLQLRLADGREFYRGR